MSLLNHPELRQFIFSQEICHTNIIQISKHCICVVLVNIKNMNYARYSHCGPIHFKYINGCEALSFFSRMSLGNISYFTDITSHKYGADYIFHYHSTTSCTSSMQIILAYS